MLTVGQYLRPTERHLPVVRYWHPDEFAALERAAYALGFEHVAAGPLVRSSYHADEHVPQERPGTGPVAAPLPPARASSLTGRFCVPAQGQHPDRPLPGRHGRVDRDQRRGLPLLPAPDRLLERGRRDGRQVRRDPLRADPPRQALRHWATRSTRGGQLDSAHQAPQTVACEGRDADRPGRARDQDPPRVTTARDPRPG